MLSVPTVTESVYGIIHAMTSSVARRSEGYVERQITTAACGHILTNSNVWSPDGKWIVYDVRSDPSGSRFDGTRIERVNVATGQTEILYESRAGACCGVASYSPVGELVVFILGPENPTADWNYAAYHRRGVIVNAQQPGVAMDLDACDLVAPYTPGALRGGSHLHIFDRAGKWISFTYEDAVLAGRTLETQFEEINLRCIGVSVPGMPVRVPRASVRNQHGNYFSVLVTRLHANPIAGSDQIAKASEESWVGAAGYLRQDGRRQKHAIAFQGIVADQNGKLISELFIVDIPEDVTREGDGPLQGSTTRRPMPPAGCEQRRLTFTQGRKYPGIQGPRHWAASSSDGSQIAFLMRDDAGIVQMFTTSPTGGSMRQLTHHLSSIASAFSWSRDDRCIACIMDNSVFAIDVSTGVGNRITHRSGDESAPRPEACVFSPDGKSIAYVRPVPDGKGVHNQIFVAELE